MEEETLSDTLKVLVEHSGYPVHIHSDFCKKWKETHENCTRCESDSGCSRLVKIMLLQVRRCMYKADGFADELDADKILEKEITKILTPDQGVL